MTQEEQELLSDNRRLAAIAYDLLLLTLSKVPPMSKDMRQYFANDLQQIIEYYQQMEGFTPALIMSNDEIYVLNKKDIKIQNSI
jgi:hypothetical protein